MIIFEILVGTLNPSSTRSPVFCSPDDRKLIWPPYDNSGEGNSLKVLAFYFACFYQNCIEIVFLGKFNVQAFRVQEFPTVGKFLV